MGPKRIKYFTILPLKQTSSASNEKKSYFSVENNLYTTMVFDA